MSFKEVGAQLKTRRKELNILQSDLAELADICVNTLYKIERAHANPTLEVLSKIINAPGLKLNLTVNTPIADEKA
ncbi:MAG: transcriptional regulator with XRE-family HTH domain [Vicingaceae bacterium]|jgi:transcriptional regulator with XRE-family HTH domain